MSTQDEHPDQGQASGAENPEPDEEAVEKAGYQDDRPTAVLPGSGGTVSGTVVSDWLDDEGNPKFEGLPDGD